MEYKEMSVRLKRDVRLARYNVSQCEVSFTVSLKPGEDVDNAYNELCEDVKYAVEEMVEVEKEDYIKSLKEIKRNAIENK